MNTFQQLGLEENILQAINDLGFEKPSEVQEKSIREFYENQLKGYMKKAGFDDDAIRVLQQGTRKVNGRNLKDYAVYVKYVDPQNPSVVKYVQTAVLEGKGVIDGGSAFAVNTVVKATDVADTIAGKALPKNASQGRKFLDSVKDITMKNKKTRNQPNNQ